MGREEHGEQCIEERGEGKIFKDWREEHGNQCIDHNQPNRVDIYLTHWSHYTIDSYLTIKIYLLQP